MKLILIILGYITVSIIYLFTGILIACKYKSDNAVATVIFAYFWPVIIVIDMLRRLFRRSSNEKRE